MKAEKPAPFAEKLIAWSYSISFPLGVAILIYLRLHYGYDWPFSRRIGLALSCITVVLLLTDIFLPDLVHGHSRVLKWQSIYLNSWASLVGIWLYWQLWGDLGLTILIAIALPLWPLSHREVLRVEGL